MWFVGALYLSWTLAFYGSQLCAKFLLRRDWYILCFLQNIFMIQKCDDRMLCYPCRLSIPRVFYHGMDYYNIFSESSNFEFARTYVGTYYSCLTFLCYYPTVLLTHPTTWCPFALRIPKIAITLINNSVWVF